MEKKSLSKPPKGEEVFMGFYRVRGGKIFIVSGETAITIFVNLIN